MIAPQRVKRLSEPHAFHRGSLDLVRRPACVRVSVRVHVPVFILGALCRNHQFVCLLPFVVQNKPPLG